MSDGKIKREGLVGSLLIALGLFISVIVYFAVTIQIDILDLGGLNVRGSMNNLVALLTALSVGCLFLGVVSGFLIGKNRRS